MLNLDNLSSGDTLPNLLNNSLKPLIIGELIILTIFNGFNKRPF